MPLTNPLARWEGGGHAEVLHADGLHVTLRSTRPFPPGRPAQGALTPMGLRDHRETYVAKLRAYNAGEGKRMRSWNLPFLIRHSAFHAMDHAWEMEDKDLTAPAE